MLDISKKKVGHNMLIIQPIGGLCNRMRAINSARILAEKRGDFLIVLWFENAELNCPFEELFKSSPSLKSLTLGKTGTYENCGTGLPASLFLMWKLEHINQKVFCSQILRCLLGSAAILQRKNIFFPVINMIILYPQRYYRIKSTS